MTCPECDGRGEREVRETVRYYDLGYDAWLVHQEPCEECDGTGEVKRTGPFVCLYCWGKGQCRECASTGIQQCGRCGRQDATEETCGDFYCVDCAVVVERDAEFCRRHPFLHEGECDMPRRLRYEYLSVDEQGEAEMEESMAFGFRLLRDLNEAWEEGEV